MNKEQATKITEAILSELEGRAGIGDQIDLIRDDSEVWDEMHACLVQTVLDASEGRK